MRKRIKLFLIGTLVAFLGLVCVGFSSECTGRMNTMPSIEEIESKVNNKDQSTWQAREIKIDPNDDLKNIYFYDEAVGYGVGYAKNSVSRIFRTLNGGESWENVSSFEGFRTEDIFFVTSKKGFLVISKLDSSSTEPQSGSEVMKTEDGGRTWVAVYSSDLADIRKISFRNGNGVAVGGYSSSNKWLSVNFVLITTDEGQTWKDVSEGLNTVADANSEGWVGDNLNEVILLQTGEILGFSARNKIFKTVDNGKSWTLTATLMNEPAQTAIHRAGELSDGTFWVGGGAISTEGNWGMMALLNRGKWVRHRLSGYSFSDIQFFSKNEVLVSGVAVAPNNFGGKNELNRGVILYSSDAGGTWTNIYESSAPSRFDCIARLSQSKFVVGGTDGKIVLLTKSTAVDQ